MFRSGPIPGHKMPQSKLWGERRQGLHDGRGLAWHRPQPVPTELGSHWCQDTGQQRGGGGGLSRQECRQPSGGEECVKSSWLGGDVGTWAPRSHSMPGKGQASYVSSGRGLSAQLGSQGNSRMTTWPWPRLGGGVAVCKRTGSGQGGVRVVPEARLAPTPLSPVVRCPVQWAPQEAYPSWLSQPGASSQMGAGGAA